MEKVFFTTSDGVRICGLLDELNAASKHVLIIVHGFSSSKLGDSPVSLATETHKRNMNTLRIDLCGCGESEGEFENQTNSKTVLDILASIAFVKQQGYEVIDLSGTSAGGLSVLSCALSDIPIRKIILQAPVSDYPSQRLRKMGQDQINDWARTGFTTYHDSKGKEYLLSYQIHEDSKKYVIRELARKIHYPVLILHGDEDDVVLLQDSQELVQYLPNAKLVVLPGADHALRVNGNRDEANKLICDWLLAE